MGLSFCGSVSAEDGGSGEAHYDFRDVYNVKTDSSSRAIRREQILENFYNHLNFKERESLWLTFFEELSEADARLCHGDERGGVDEVFL